MDLDLKLLSKLSRVCRKYGIAHFKNEQFEISLTEVAKKKPAPKKLVEVKLPQPYAELTEDELLFGSGS